MRLVFPAAATALLLTLRSTALAQTAPEPGPNALSSVTAFRPTVAGVTIDGPPPPLAPEVMARDQAGRVTVRAVRVSEPIRVDGALDEAIYHDTPPMTGFVQIEPNDLAPATEDTQVWVAFDDENVYVSMRCLDSDIGSLVANEMRRDSGNIFQGNDIAVFMFDTFYDRRNGVIFTVNPVAGKMEGQVTNELQYNGDWNPVYTVKTSRFAAGWSLEVAIPFKSLKYRPGRDQVWGFNALRLKRSKNEISVLSHVPKARGQQAMRHASAAATLVGLETPRGALNLDVKPFVTSNVATNLTLNPAVENRLGKDGGLDVKYGLTQNLTADLTVRTDFAQVEADEQQVNLTRFNLFFPEKRDFFLENQGTFVFGGLTATGAVGNTDTPTLFYSRRIGLNRNTEVPIRGGGRVTGRAGSFVIGALNIETGDEPVSKSDATNFSVVRVKRDILRKSDVGIIFTDRSVRQNGAGRNQTYGADATFGFFQNLAVNTYWAETRTDGQRSNASSYRVQLDYPGDRYGVTLERLYIGKSFNPEAGFVRRTDMVKDYALFRFSPRPKSRTIRKYSYTGSVNRIRTTAGRLETRALYGEFAIEFQNADRLSAAYTDEYEYLPAPFVISTTKNITLPVGAYEFGDLLLTYNMGQQRKLSLNLLADYGQFYDGYKTTIGASRGRVNFTTLFSVEPTYTLNRVRLDEGAFTTHLAGARIVRTMTPLMFVSALVQYNSTTQSVSANVRWRWEYQPGSELFIVYNEERNTAVPGFPSMTGRTLILKINRLFRF